MVWNEKNIGWNFQEDFTIPNFGIILKFKQGKNEMRKLATIREIDEIKPIPDADSIECAVVGGWQVVTQKNEFKKGDIAIYVEVDSWVPTEIAPFLSKGQEPREYNGVKGERLRTVKLRGQISQGLLLKVYDFPKVVAAYHKTRIYVPNEMFDVTDILGIQKYEPPVPAQLYGTIKGYFPSYIPRTDQERCQNLVPNVKEWSDNSVTWELTEKLDGSSMTVYIKDGEVGVCSRNLELKEDSSNTLWATARGQGIIDAIQQITELKAFAVQGEMIGEGIQGNSYKIKGHKFYVFDIYDINSGRYLSSSERIAICEKYGLLHVPVISLSETISEDVFVLLKNAEGKSVLNNTTEREGIVYKAHTIPNTSFKAISNRFLMKTGG